MRHLQYHAVCLKRFKDRLVGPFQHCIRRLIVLLPSHEFLRSSPEAPRTTQARETSASEGRNYLPRNLAGTWDRFFHFPSEGRHAEDYSDTRKIPTVSAGFEPANSGYQRPAC